MPVFYYDPPDRFVAGSVGQPGDRTFYLQATSAGRVTSVAPGDLVSFGNSEYSLC